mgnify:CR=1 FL=1
MEDQSLLGPLETPASLLDSFLELELWQKAN